MNVNPNSMIPCMVDNSDPSMPVRLFESGAILLHLAEKYGKFLPSSPQSRAECMSWLFWQVGSAPYLGAFNMYYFYANEDELHRDSIDRWALESKRQLAVLDSHLRGRKYIC